MPAMRTIEVRRTIHAQPERVFDVLADHEGYARFPGVRAAVLLRQGKPDRNGVGALRKIDLGAAWFEEEITAFERPARIEYRIVRSRPPLVHEGGRITFAKVSSGVEVVWTSTLRVALPLIGGLATAFAARRMSRDFAKVLALVEELAR